MRLSNKTILILASAMCLSLRLGEFAQAASLPMPDEAHDISLGMSFDDFLKLRPKIRERISRDPEFWPGKSVTLSERFSSGKHFSSAIYFFEQQQLVGLSLYMTEPDKAQTKLRRRALHKDCLARWGAVSRKQIGKLEPHSKQPRSATPAVIWENSSATIHLFAPDTGRPKDPKAILTIVASKAAKRLAPGYEEEPVPAAEQRRGFASAGLDADE